MPDRVLVNVSWPKPGLLMRISEDILWRYIDGDCSEREEVQVSARLRADAKLRALYSDLLAYHERLGELFAREADPHVRRLDGELPAVARLSRNYDVCSPVRSN